MGQIRKGIQAAVLGGALVAANAASAANCKSGDLSGAWRFYATSFTASAPYVLHCKVKMSPFGSNPITYSMTGTCIMNTAASQNNTLLSIGSSALTETKTCKLKGSLQFGIPGYAATVTILDAAIENPGAKAPKTHIAGVGRFVLTNSPDEVWNFNFVR